MKNRILVCTLLLLSIAGCSRSSGITVLKEYPLDSISNVIARSGVAIDKKVVSRGNGSLRVSAATPVNVRLFETGPLDVENSRLIYQARLRAEGLEGKAYLEMLVVSQDGREFFSRGFNSPLMGDVGWTTETVPFFLEKGQQPKNIKLNLVIDGTGIVWVDDVRLLKAPLKEE